jgi:uracil-DNA glycosylase
MLVGQAPGKVEMGGGRPFAGRSGQTLFRWFEAAGMDEEAVRSRIYIAAITRCFPGPHPSGRGDRVPSPVERENCRPWLEAELAIIRPRLLIPVGRLAVDHFLGAVPLSEVVGRAIRVEHVGGVSTAVALPHPSGASGWLNVPAHRELLGQAIGLLRDGLCPGANSA